MLADEKAEAAAIVAKAGPPTVASGAALFGYPVSDLILWLTLAWWVWIISEKIHQKIARKKRRRRGD